ncbi:MAG: CoA transferase [Mogibacterium sp.]|nr:CoA transferase [Mogibacterium sp.]MBQ3370503.1 CoA transferase [Mogibacterium sp.]
MSEVRRPLEGIKVVELATFIAAPCTARFLADLGADVIKVEAPMGDPLRYTAANEGRPLDQKENTSYDLENAGKRCIALNIKSPEGREVLEKLIADADVFITNNRQPSLIKNKLDYDTLHAKYPSLVYGFISGYGEKGPDKDLPGFDFTAFYARGGILGPLRDKTSTPMLTVQGFGDHQVAMNLAAGILASLFKAKMTGEGDQVVVSLFHSAVWDVSLMLQSSQYGADSCKFPMERWENGNPLTMVYKTKDEQWLQIAMPQYDRHYPVFMQAAGHPEMIDNPKFFPQKNLYPNRKEFSEWISALFLTKDCAEWCKLLDAADIPYAVAQNWDTLLVDKQAWASDIFYEMQYSNGNKRTLVRPPVMFKENGLPEYNRGPYLAEHTEEILGQYGYTDEEISKMLADGAVKSMDPALRD